MLTPKLSIIIVNYNAGSYLSKCLQSIKDNISCEYEIIIVDNGSSDGSLSGITPSVKIKIIENTKNDGFAKANNIGIKQSVGEYIVLLNPDTELLNDAFDIMLRYMESNKDACILAPKLLNTDGSLQASARKFPNIKTAFLGRTSLLTKFFPENKFIKKSLSCLSHNSSKPLAVDWVSGACMMIKRQVIEEIGLLDENYYMYWEDADWCKRVHQRGHLVVWLPEALLYHHAGKSSLSLNTKIKTIIYFNKSVYYYFSKHISKNILIKTVVFFGLLFRVVIKVVHAILTV